MVSGSCATSKVKKYSGGKSFLWGRPRQDIYILVHSVAKILWDNLSDKIR